MAIQTGAIKYRGSFKSIRNYLTLHDSNTYAGEKGGANRDLIMNNPAFARTRENMNEFAGCGVAVKALRSGFLNLLPDQADRYFISRLMSIAKEVNRHDIEGSRGKRSIIFSSAKPVLMKIVFSVLQNVTWYLKKQFVCTHPVSRAEASLKVTDLLIKKALTPAGATHYRIQNHLSAISDYSYSEMTRQYEPVDPFNTQSTFKYSEYTPIDTALTAELKAAYPEGSLIGEDCTIIQSVGIEFYVSTNGTEYCPLKGSSMLVIDTF